MVEKKSDTGDKDIDNPNIDGDEEVAHEQRFQAQCFLLRNISSDLLKNRTTKYSDITVMRGQPNMIINALTSRPGASVLFSLTSEEMARLVPYIKIYKIYHLTRSSQPVKYLFPFSMGSFVDKRFGKHNLGDIFKSKGARGADAGIESVNFELLATNPAEVKNHIKCTVNLFFRNLSVLDQKMTVPHPTDRSTADLSYSDLILRPGKPKITAGTDFDPSSYVIQLVVGWNEELSSTGYTGVTMPDPDNPDGAPIDRSKAIKKALRKTQLSLTLTLKKHAFTFQPDGSVKLEIEYHAWAEGAMSSPASNIFYVKGDHATQIEQLKAAKEFRKRQQSEGLASDEVAGSEKSQGTAWYNPGGMFGDSDQENMEEDIEKINKKIIDIKKGGMGEAWKRIIMKLIAKNQTPQTVKLYVVDVPLKSLAGGIEKISTGGKMIEEDVTGKEDQLKRKFARRYNRRQCRSIKSERGKSLKRHSSGGLAKRTGKMTNVERGKLYKGGLESDLAEVFERQINGDDWNEDDPVTEAMDQLVKLTPAKSIAADTHMRVVYFFLGDLINTVVKILNESKEWQDNPASELGILLGPMSFSHPCMPEDIVDKNIADIPISLSLFTAWFIRKVIAKQRDTYLLRSFINDVIGELVAPALGEQCTEGLGKVTVNVSTNVYSIKTDNIKAARAGPPIKKGTSISHRELREIIGTYKLDDPDSALVREFPYVFLYSSAKSGAQLKCHRGNDETKGGIYHFDFGRDDGVIYKMEFEKNDAPYLGEAKVTGKNNIGSDLGGGAIYNVNIDMFGNSVFWPGQYIYVNPGSLDIGATTKCPDLNKKAEDQPIYHRIRLGGYYLITKVKGSLERGKYITSITARFETAGGQKTKSPTKAPHELFTTADPKGGDPVIDQKKKDEIVAGLALADADEFEENP